MILRSHRADCPLQAVRPTRTGFTLLEVLVVVAIIVMLAGVGGYYLIQRYEEAKFRKAQADCLSLSAAVETFRLNNDEYPQSLEQLAGPQPRGGTALVEPAMLRDPWGQMYQVDPTGPRNNGLKADVFTAYQGKEISNASR